MASRPGKMHVETRQAAYQLVGVGDVLGENPHLGVQRIPVREFERDVLIVVENGDAHTPTLTSRRA